MPQAGIQRAATSPGFAGLPIRVQQAPSRVSAVSRLVLLMPAALAIAALLAVLATNLVAEPSQFATILARPFAAAQITLGLAVLGGLILVPARRAVADLWSWRQVEILGGIVTVTEGSAFGRRTWSSPVASYLGLAHHIRASLSGLAHEIVLVHPDPARSVTLLAGDRVTEATIGEFKALLGLPEISPVALYAGRSRSRADRKTPGAPAAA